MESQMQSIEKAVQNPTLKPANASLLQRQCSCGQHAIGGECAECRKQKGVLQRAAVGPAPDPIPHIVDQVLRSPGQPLDAKTRTFMEPRFGHDFSRVRIHTDSKAERSARMVNALAYTVGRDMVFGDGQYAPGTEIGRQLLAHELTHVAQQSVGNIPISKEAICKQEPSSVHRSELQAEDIAERIGSGGTVGRDLLPVYSNVLQKAEKLGSRMTQPKGVKSPHKKITTTFDGKDFVMLGDGKQILRAAGQSGRPYTVRAADAKACRGSSDDSYLNNPRYVGIVDNGPIPEGEFTFRLTDMVMFTAEEQMKMSLAAEGEYTDPSGASLHGDWGSGRAPLRPVRIVPTKLCGNTKGRSGFYLHGGIMPGSSGCIDIGNDAMRKVASAMMGYIDPVHLFVKYTHPPPKVGFIDRAAGRFMYPPGKDPSIMGRLKSVFGGGDE